MAKIVDYRIASDGDYDSLASEVRDYMRQGWQPIGGVSMTETQYVDGRNMDGTTHTDGTIRFAQAMVKYEPEPNRNEQLKAEIEFIDDQMRQRTKGTLAENAIVDFYNAIGPGGFTWERQANNRSAKRSSVSFTFISDEVAEPCFDSIVSLKEIGRRLAQQLATKTTEDE